MMTNARDRLLELGLQWLRHGGVRGLKVRALCQEAGVSPGTFTAHFRNLRTFSEELLRLWYEPLMTPALPPSAQAKPMQVLRAELSAVAAFARRHLDVIFQLLMDARAGVDWIDYSYLADLAQLHHVKRLCEAIEAAQAAGCIVQAPALQVLAHLAGSTNMASFICNMLPTERMLHHPMLREQVLALPTDAFAEQRMEWALRGITLQPESELA
ncbi:MAG: TetR/AcrR family transcriptional regulator [Akkermansia sp.]